MLQIEHQRTGQRSPEVDSVGVGVVQTGQGAGLRCTNRKWVPPKWERENCGVGLVKIEICCHFKESDPAVCYLLFGSHPLSVRVAPTFSSCPSVLVAQITDLAMQAVTST
ncbi:hypothetical protein V1264_009423 [Littorina saxatilis]|uniref:Uncharacterized protein n=1 Tax=Littorina saxatilis TaxID=31220 RepID=A0AAN9ARQ3_9CAEN